MKTPPEAKNSVYTAYTKWMEGNGPDSQIVISSRVRLARNLAGQPAAKRGSA